MRNSRFLNLLGIRLSILIGLLFLFGTCNNSTSPSSPPVDPGVVGKAPLLIWQVGSGRDGAVSHSFVELYNPTAIKVSLQGYTLWYSRSEGGDDWENIALTGSIPPGRSFFILGRPGIIGGMQEPNIPGVEGNGARLVLATYSGYNPPQALSVPFLEANPPYKPVYPVIGGKDFSADMYCPEMVLSNNQFKVALIYGTETLDGVANPFNIDGYGTKVDGYIDLLGAINGTSIDACEGTVMPKISKQQSACRVFVDDTDDNSVDFTNIDYQTTGTTDFQVLLYRPKGTRYGAWKPLSKIKGTEGLMILQANTYGNNNGMDQTPPSPTGGGFARSLVELYNNTGTAIDLNAGNYYLHIGTAGAWTNAIKLTGSVPAHSSFLIVDNTDPGVAGTNMNATPRAILPEADQSENFVINNKDFKVAVLKNQSTLSVDNPFGNPGLTSDYVDMLGVGTANGYEGAAAKASRPQGPRRVSLVDTNSNISDFQQADFRGRTASGKQGIADAELYKFWPRNSSSGVWDPISGMPVINP